MVLPFFVRNILSGGESSPEGGLDKFWSKEVKLTKKGRGESSPEGGLDNFWSKGVKLTKKDREGENMKK